MKINLIRLEKISRIFALEYSQMNSGSRVKILPNDHDSFSQLRERAESTELHDRKR